ncbi:MAG: Mitochondrial inner membrane organizing system component [Pleopsidium flavum]|nr:MAG: Mitochondrial inner membrane organizing system component [Pleopsidium flavum]
MADTPPATPSAPVMRSSKPVSEALLNEKWDHAISSLLIRSSLGLSFGVVFSVLLFKRRAWPAWVGLGFGAGRAWEEADAMFKRGDTPTGKEGLRMVRT